MGFRIGSGTAAASAQRFLEKSQRQVEKSLKALASGSRIVNAGDDAAGFAISENLRGQASGLKQARFNAQNATSLIQTAEGSLNEQNNILIRMRELGVQAASDTIGDNERGFLDKEFQQLQSEFDRIAQTTQFGSKKLLTGTGEEFEFQVGANKDENSIIKFTLEADTSGSNAGIDGLEISDQDSALDSLAVLDEAVFSVADARSTFGAVQSRFQYVVDNLSVQKENIDEAASLITDVDIAMEMTNLTKARIQQDIGTAVVAQSQQDSERALRFLT